MRWKTAMRRVMPAIALAFGVGASQPALAWGDEAHEVIALIASHYLTPATRRAVDNLLAADPDPLTAHDIAAEATWADKYRDLGGYEARERTRRWHFVDLELASPVLSLACFGEPPLPVGTPASRGPAEACLVDKINQFQSELASPATRPDERIIALKFLLHLVGDLHQPLHAADNHDRGGNEERVKVAGWRAGTLHHYWDAEFVVELGRDPEQIAAVLSRRVPPAAARAWSSGTPADWAMESFRVAQADAYGRLPTPNARGQYRLADDYVAMATRDVGEQLSKAGVRLAFMLNAALGPR